MIKLHQLLTTQSANLFDEQGFAVHCPMVLSALSSLGASDEQLQNYFEIWQKENPALANSVGPTNQSNLITATTWRQSLKNVQDFSALQQFFQNWIEESAPEIVMQQVLSQIPPAPASVAFHGLIRTAHGLEVNHAGEIAAGLAALVVRNFWFDLPQPARPVQVQSVAQALAHFSERMSAFDTPKVNITARMQAVVDDPRFAHSLPAVPANAFAEMQQNAIKLYVQHQNFTTLHMVTALHAAHKIFTRLPDALFERYLPAVWSAYCAAYVSTGAPRIVDAPVASDTLLPWKTLFAAACESNRDHMIKMIYTCHQQYQRATSSDLKLLYLAGANSIFTSC